MSLCKKNKRQHDKLSCKMEKIYPVTRAYFSLLQLIRPISYKSHQLVRKRKYTPCPSSAKCACCKSFADIDVFSLEQYILRRSYKTIVSLTPGIHISYYWDSLMRPAYTKKIPAFEGRAKFVMGKRSNNKLKRVKTREKVEVEIVGSIQKRMGPLMMAFTQLWNRPLSLGNSCGGVQRGN